MSSGFASLTGSGFVARFGAVIGPAGLTARAGLADAAATRFLRVAEIPVGVGLNFSINAARRDRRWLRERTPRVRFLAAAVTAGFSFTAAVTMRLASASFGNWNTPRSFSFFASVTSSAFGFDNKSFRDIGHSFFRSWFSNSHARSHPAADQFKYQ